MKILVIEDNQKHLRDAINYSESLVGCDVDFATSLAEAFEFLRKNKYDCVISDVFFPAEQGASSETFANALAINRKLVEEGIHHVFNTAGNHHGKKFNGFLHKTPHGFNGFDRDHFCATGMVMEAYPEDCSAEKDSKQWKAAFRYVLIVQALIHLPDKGVSIVNDAASKEKRERGGIWWHGFSYGDYGESTGDFERCSIPFIVKTFQKFNA